MSVWYEDALHLTERQVEAMIEADARVESIAGRDLGRWYISYEQEQRPGRGRDITAWSVDGEYMATQYLDVYGNGSLVVSAIDLIHNDSDEEHFDEEGKCEHD